MCFTDKNDMPYGIVERHVCKDNNIFVMEVVGLGWFMVFNVAFNSISVISWRSVLLVEETGVPVENHHPVPNH
jgi:hypothetical protein